MSHTQGKLRAGAGSVCKDTLYDERGDCLAVCFAVSDHDSEANAARIVQCWNSHDALVEACKAALEYVSQDEALIAQLRAALAQAEGGAA